MSVSELKVVKENEPTDSVERGMPCDAVELMTENGFGIVRSDEDCERLNALGKYRFRVKSPEGWESEVVVEFTSLAKSFMERFRRGPFVAASSFWLTCAERSLSTYLWGKGKCPNGQRLLISEPCIDDLELARRWQDD